MRAETPFLQGELLRAGMLSPALLTCGSTLAEFLAGSFQNALCVCVRVRVRACGCSLPHCLLPVLHVPVCVVLMPFAPTWFSAWPEETGSF